MPGCTHANIKTRFSNIINDIIWKFSAQREKFLSVGLSYKRINSFKKCNTNLTPNLIEISFTSIYLRSFLPVELEIITYQYRVNVTYGSLEISTYLYEEIRSYNDNEL